MAGLEDTIRRLWPALKERVDTLEDRRRIMMDQLNDLNAEIEKAKQEFAAIDNAAKTLSASFTLELSANEEPKANFAKLYKYGDVTIKQAARLTLADLNGGLNSHELFSRLNKRYFEDRLDRTSFSPQLSRLKRDGEVEDKGYGWVLTEKGRLMMGQDKILPYSD